MLSRTARLVAKRPLTALLASYTPISHTLARHMSTADAEQETTDNWVFPPHFQAEIERLDEEEKEHFSKPGVIEEYGRFPFFAFTSVILISKEFVIVNEELLLAALIGNCMFAMYVMGREPLGNWLDSLNYDINKGRVQRLEERISEFKKLAVAMENKTHIIPHLTKAEERRVQVKTDVAHARMRRKRDERANHVQERLDRIMVFEKDLELAEQAVLNRAVEIMSKKAVVEEFSTKKGTDKAIADAISGLSGGRLHQGIVDKIATTKLESSVDFNDPDQLPADVAEAVKEDLEVLHRKRELFKNLLGKLSVIE